MKGAEKEPEKRTDRSRLVGDSNDWYLVEARIVTARDWLPG